MTETKSTMSEATATSPAPPAEASMQVALNLALKHTLAEDDRTLVFGEDVAKLGGVFRVTDGLQKEFGIERVFDSQLAEASIIGMAVGLALHGYRPIPEIQFDGFAYPAMNQIVTQMARMNHRSRGTAPMPITLRLPSFGGIRAPEFHGESLESLLAHVPGLKVVSPSTPNEAYQLLRQSIADPDPVVFMEPKARYWNKAAFDPTSPPSDYLPVGTSRTVRSGTHVTLIAWGAMVAKCLQAAELAEEDGVQIEVIDLRWLKPIDAAGLEESVSRTRRAVVVHEAPFSGGLGGEVSSIITERCFDSLRAPVQRVTGYDVPYPSGALEDQYLPSVNRILSAVQRVLEYRRG